MVAIPDSYDRVREEILRRKDTAISVPELSQLLRVKTTTINARFRRQKTPVNTVGRTNYVRSDLALPLVDIHKYALKGWPTLQDVSRSSGIKSGTLKARCEKGKIENYIDLTKRLRLNPDEAATLTLEQAQILEQKDQIIPQPPVKKTYTPFSGQPSRRVSTPSPAKQSYTGLPTPRAPFNLPPAPEPRVQIITASDYGMDHRSAEKTNTCARTASHMQKKRGALNYNPEKPFSIAECSVGKTIKYEHYDGTIIKLFHDPFNPTIKVALPNHEEPLMREIMLRVAR